MKKTYFVFRSSAARFPFTCECVELAASQQSNQKPCCMPASWLSFRTRSHSIATRVKIQDEPIRHLSDFARNITYETTRAVLLRIPLKLGNVRVESSAINIHDVSELLLETVREGGGSGGPCLHWADRLETGRLCAQRWIISKGGTSEEIHKPFSKWINLREILRELHEGIKGSDLQIFTKGHFVKVD